MAHAGIDQLIINSPYAEPTYHWEYVRHERRFRRAEGRRPAGHLIATRDAKSFDDPGVFVEIPLVNRIRKRVAQWRDKGYPGTSSITRRLLDYWQDPAEFDTRRFFFCQLEAAETLIWLTEGPAVDHVGLDIPRDGDTFRRLCAKMATGTGKTVVMAMILAWQILNKVARPTDRRFSKSALVVAPGLTVRNRLAVLNPSHEDNYYDLFRVVPPTIREKLNQGKVVIWNWHALAWQTGEQIAKRRSVDKRGPLSDEAYVRNVLGDLSRTRNILVINDEAHHAWRVSDRKTRGIAKSAIDEATKWVGSLDRIHRTRGISMCYDFSATPFAPSGKRSKGENLFGWIVSDFGLNDAIEAGLVKTPRVVVRDDTPLDAKTYKSRFYHLYNDPDVKPDLNRRSPPETPLPSLVTQAYYFLGYDWRETRILWERSSAATPPVMITVANRTETAARVRHAFDRHMINIPELCDPTRTLHIDSKVLSKAEAETAPVLSNAKGGAQKKLNRKEEAERLRTQVDTVGKPGKAGADIQNVISVGMLSEGWDAKTVTHIMGLRAFSSQLLCEQVVGRGLRRTSYDVNPDTELFETEYVNIFGIPFSFLPHEYSEGMVKPATPKTVIEPLKTKAHHALSWPNILRINEELSTRLTLDLNALPSLELDANQTPRLAELAPIVAGKPDTLRIKRIDLLYLAREFRTQRIIFETVRRIHDLMSPNWSGGRVLLLAQLVRLTEQFMHSSSLKVVPSAFEEDPLKRRLVLTLNMEKVVRHIGEAIREQNVTSQHLIFDTDHPVLSTGDMQPWNTGRPCIKTGKSHINFCVCDSTWEELDARMLDESSCVKSWAKNDHLGFEIYYIYRGTVRKYRPDFIVELTSGDKLILETKGTVTDEVKAKHRSLNNWIRAVNSHGGFGRWHCAMADEPGKIQDILHRHWKA